MFTKKELRLINSLIEYRIEWYNNALRYIDDEHLRNKTNNENIEYFETLKEKHNEKIDELMKLQLKLFKPINQ